MTTDDLQLLSASVGKDVKITCTDGEVLVARIDSVSEEDSDVIYELISTSNESHYEKYDQQPAYRIGFVEIVKVEPA